MQKGNAQPWNLQQWVRQHWQNKNWFSLCLWPASLLFGAVANLRRVAYRLGILHSEHAGIPTIIVGNVVVGGVGKTPLVIALVQSLRVQGFTPAILTRGYGAKLNSMRPTELTSTPNARAETQWNPEVVQPVHDDAKVHKTDTANSARMLGDEAVLLANATRCPVWVGRNRVAAARALRQAHPECNVIVCDDGLQHYALARDIEIVVFDARLGGNGFLLPAGPLREKMTRARDFSVLNCSASESDLDASSATTLAVPTGWFAMRTHLQDAWCLNAPTQHVTLRSFIGKQIAAMAGIGHPERFFTALEQTGLHIMRHPFADHAKFAHNPFVNMQAEIILMTEKDAVKCAAYHDERAWVVPLGVQLDDAFVAQLLTKLLATSER